MIPEVAVTCLRGFYWISQSRLILSLSQRKSEMVLNSRDGVLLKFDEDISWPTMLLSSPLQNGWTKKMKQPEKRLCHHSSWIIWSFIIFFPNRYYGNLI
jgi:hypothetical protein